jgi:hypothetical protein
MDWLESAFFEPLLRLLLVQCITVRSHFLIEIRMASYDQEMWQSLCFTFEFRLLKRLNSWMGILLLLFDLAQLKGWTFHPLLEYVEETHP